MATNTTPEKTWPYYSLILRLTPPCNPANKTGFIPLFFILFTPLHHKVSLLFFFIIKMKSMFVILLIMVVSVVRGQWSSELPERNFFILEDGVLLYTNTIYGAVNNSKSFDVAFSMLIYSLFFSILFFFFFSQINY